MVNNSSRLWLGHSPCKVTEKKRKHAAFSETNAFFLKNDALRFGKRRSSFSKTMPFVFKARFALGEKGGEKMSFCCGNGGEFEKNLLNLQIELLSKSS